MLLATVVAIMTCLTVANATQTITTPNAVKITYNLAAGTSSAAITPATNISVSVMGSCTNKGGVGQVTLQHIPSNGIYWVGLESPTGFGSDITSGFTATPGAHIVYIEINHQVDIQVASIDTILIHNGAAAPRTGNVTLVW